MPLDKTNLVSEIRQLLSSKKVLPELIADVAAEYTEACVEINERLGNVSKLLADGLRDEAIELAERRPKLLSYLQLVDFPERAQWNQMLAKANAGHPPELLVEEAEQLERAYEEQRELAPLMRQHRLLALSSAPLAVRLRILRRLEKQDPANPIWRDDIEDFEHARMDEIQGELAKAKKARDIGNLQKLVEELEGPWTVSPPKRIVENARQLLVEQVQQNAREQMAPLVAELNDCLVAFELKRGRLLRTQWLALAEKADLADSDPLVERTREAMLWLDEADQQSGVDDAFNEAVAELERAVEDRVSLIELERALYAVQKFSREIPAALARRAKQYHSSLTLDQSRRSRLRLAAIVVVVVFVGVSLFWYFWTRSRQNQLFEARAQLAQFVDQPNFSSAKQFFNSLPPVIQQDGEILRTWDAISERESGTNARSAEFEKLFATIDLTGPLGDQIDELAKRTAEFATTQDQSTRIQSLQSQIKIERTRRQEKRNDAFLAKLQPIAERIQDLEDVPLAEADIQATKDLRAELEALKNTHNEMVDGLPNVAPSILSQTTQLANRLDSRLGSMNEYAISVAQLDQITDAVGSVDQFKGQLTRFAEQHTSFPLSADFLTVANLAPQWASFVAWRELADEKVWDNPLGVTAARSQELLDQIAKLRAQPLVANIADEIVPCERYLQQVITAYAKDAELPQKLDLLVKKYSRLEYREQRVLVDATRKFKYFAADPKPKDDADKTWFYFFKDLTRSKTENELIDHRELAKCSTGIAGQAALAESLCNLLKSTDPNADRDEFLRQAIERALASPATEVPVDEIVQAVMVKEVLEVAANHGLFWQPFANKGLQKVLAMEATLAGTLAETDWMMFEEAETATRRRKFGELLAELRTDFRAAQLSVAAEREQCASLGKWRTSVNYRWIGWIHNHNGQWQLATVGSRPEAGSYYALLNQRPNEPATFQIIGTIKDGHFAIFNSKAVLNSGHPVFVRVEGE